MAPVPLVCEIWEGSRGLCLAGWLPRLENCCSESEVLLKCSTGQRQMPFTRWNGLLQPHVTHREDHRR
jgi:hypothetical protein